MKEKTFEQELLLELFKDNRNHNRHHVAQRTIMTNIILVIFVALVGVITFDKSLNIYDLPFSMVILALGIFGISSSLKYGARSEYHWDLASDILKYLSVDASTLVNDFKKNYEYRPYYNSWFVNKVVNKTVTEFWVYLHLFITLMGVLIFNYYYF